LFRRQPITALGALGIENAGFAVEHNPTASRLLETIRLHVDVLLHLAWQLDLIGRQKSTQMACKNVQLFEVYVRESQNFSKEGIEAQVVRQLAPKIMLLRRRDTFESLDYWSKRSIEPVLG